MTPDHIIWQSAQNLMKSQVNLDKLYDAFDVVECDEAELVIEFEDSGSEGKDWVTPIWSAYYSVKMRPGKRMVQVGWITLAVQLTSEEGTDDNWEHGRRAKVLAGYSPHKDFENAWFFDVSSPDSSGKCEDCEVDAHRWIMSEDGRDSWFFSIALDALTNTARVEQCIAQPLKRILRSEKPTEVLSEIEEFLCPPPR